MRVDVRRSWLTRFTHDLLAPTFRPTTAGEYPRSSSTIARRRLSAHALSSTGCPDFPTPGSDSFMMVVVVQKPPLLKRHVMASPAHDPLKQDRRLANYLPVLSIGNEVISTVWTDHPRPPNVNLRGTRRKFRAQSLTRINPVSPTRIGATREPLRIECPSIPPLHALPPTPAQNKM